MVIVSRFPTPPGSILLVLEQVAILRRADPKEMAAAGDLSEVPRPWDPPTCPAEIRETVWGWCDDVAAWLNREYAWRATQMIPPCWPRHAHIARELPVLAFLRWTAEQSTGPELTEDWHRYTYPMFCERMFTRLGESACRTGKHAEWPAESRYATYTGIEATDDRQTVIYADTAPPRPLGAAASA